MNTKTQILLALRQEALSIAQLCERLNLTRTAVNLPIKQLLAEGLIQGRIEQSGRVGKPSVVYEAAIGTEDLGSQAYQPILSALLAQLRNDLNADAFQSLLENAGRRMAQASLDLSSDDYQAKIQIAMQAANELGATTQLQREADGSYLITNRTCLAATAVRGEPNLCQLIAAFFAEASGCTVNEECQCAERMFCQYRVIPPDMPTNKD